MPTSRWKILYKYYFHFKITCKNITNSQIIKSQCLMKNMAGNYRKKKEKLIKIVTLFAQSVLQYGQSSKLAGNQINVIVITLS